MVRRLVEHEAVDAARHAARRAARACARPARASRTAASTWSAPRSNFASSVRASSGRQARARRRRPSSSGSSPVVGRRGAGRARRARSRGRRVASPGGERQLAEQQREQRRLAAAVAAGDRDPLARREVEVDRAEPERAALADGALERGDAVAGPLRRRASESCSSHGSNGFSTRSTRSSARSAWRTFVISACVPRRSAPPVACARNRRRARLVAAGVQQRLDLAAPLLRVARSARTAAARASVARRRVLAPAAGVLADARRVQGSISAIRVTVRSRNARSCETTASAAREAVEEALEPVEPVEVEVVRRLVEQEHVEAREQDRGERRRAPPRRRRASPSPARARRRARARRTSSRARASRSAPPSARNRSSAAAYASGLQSARVPLDAGLRVGDAGAPREVGEQRLARAGGRAPAAGSRRSSDAGVRSTRALVRLVEPGEQAEQRRLAGPVRADEPEPRARAERQVDVVENGAGAERTDDAVRVRLARSLQRTRGRGRARERRGSVWVSSSPSWAGAEAPPHIVLQAGRGAPRAPTSAGRAPRSSCVCGSTFRSLPQTGQRPAQSGACRIWSGSASAIASRAHAESSSWSSTTYSLRSSSASPGSFAWYSRASIVDVDDRVREAAHARAVQAHVEREPEVEPGRRLHDRQLALDLVRHRQVALAAELERLELDRDRVAVLLARAEPEAAEREAGHARSYK